MSERDLTHEESALLAKLRRRLEDNAAFKAAEQEEAQRVAREDRLLERCRVLLEKVEWESFDIGPHDDPSIDRCCPICGQLKIFKQHIPDCELAAVLVELRR